MLEIVYSRPKLSISPLIAGICQLRFVILAGVKVLSEVLYQRPYAMTIFAHSRSVIECRRAGSAMSAFQAAQQASTMAS